MAWGIGTVEHGSEREWRIVQMLPADGWFASFTQEDGSPEYWKLVAWALVEDREGEQQVVGLVDDQDGLIDAAPDTRNFARYVHAPLLKINGELLEG